MQAGLLQSQLGFCSLPCASVVATVYIAQIIDRIPQVRLVWNASLQEEASEISENGACVEPQGEECEAAPEGSPDQDDLET